MSRADDYNQGQYITGVLTPGNITDLVREFQKSNGLVVDGQFGPITKRTLETRGVQLAWPLPVLPDGRKPMVTSGFREPDRPTHNGLDMFYDWRPGDLPDHVGDRGAAGKHPDGTPRWVVPYGVKAMAAADGKVQLAKLTPTGYSVWIDIGSGLRVGYFHLLNVEVIAGQTVTVGTPVGLVGDNPRDNDARHLHFELSPMDSYDPINPAPYLRNG